MFGLGFGEVLVILVVALLVFGPDKLPELARTLGRTMAELRRSMDDMKTEFRAPIQEFERTIRAEPISQSRSSSLSEPSGTNSGQQGQAPSAQPPTAPSSPPSGETKSVDSPDAGSGNDENK